LRTKEGEEPPLVWVANDEKLFGAGLADERLGVYACPTDLAAYRLQEWECQHAIPFVRFLVLEVDEVEDVDGYGQVGAVETFDSVQVELVERSHRLLLVREA
jgi:hypothetical protein